MSTSALSTGGSSVFTSILGLASASTSAWLVYAERVQGVCGFISIVAGAGIAILVLVLKVHEAGARFGWWKRR